MLFDEEFAPRVLSPGDAVRWQRETSGRKKRYTGRWHRLQSVATSARRFSCRYADLGGNTAPCMGLPSNFQLETVCRQWQAKQLNST